MEWSKVKAECPLCKQTFKSIVHNVRSYEDYDQYHLPQPEDRRLNNPLENLFLPSGVRFRYRTTVTDHRYAHLVNNINNEIESRLLQRPSSHLPIPNWRRIRQPANSEFRRNVYTQRLKLRTDQVNTRRRVRETSPSFYRENPAQTHRLVPWLNRELNALLHSHGSQVAFVLEMIIGLIKRYTIESEEFYQHLYPYTGRNTRRFMQEFLAFARSPYHMAAYDRHVAYEQGNEPNIDSGSESDHQADDGNDSDVVVVSPPPPSSPPPVRPGPSSISPNYLRHSNWMYNPYTPMVRSSGQDDLSTAATGHRSDLFAPPSASGWDSPTVNPSSSPPISPSYSPVVQARSPRVTSPYGRVSPNNHGLSYRRTPPVDRSSRDSNTFNPWDSFQFFLNRTSSFFAGGGNFGLTNPSSRSLSEPTVSYGGRPGSPAHIQSIAEGPSTSQGDTVSDSDSSDVEIIEVEKPWTERSPIQLSSGQESDFDVIITGMGHVDDDMKKETEKKKKKKHKRRDSGHDSERRRESGHDSERRKRHRSSTSSRDRHSKKRKHSREKSGKSRSPSRTLSTSPSGYAARSRPTPPLQISVRSPYRQRSRSRSKTPLRIQIKSPYRSRSRSKSPLRIRIQTSGYQHKKFAYKGNEKNQSPYLKDHRSSLQMRQSDNNHDSDSSYYSITSSKRRLKSGRSSIEIVEYRKTSSKHKKNKKHKDKSSEKHKQHKRDKSRDYYQSSEGSSVSRRNKSKKKKDHKEKSRHKRKHQSPEKESHRAEKSTLKSSKLPHSDTLNYTSDSESDSILEGWAELSPSRPVKVPISGHRDRIQSKQTVNENILDRSGPRMTFEEINASQAAIIDEELEAINNALQNSDYIGSLFNQNEKAPGNSAQQVVTLNTDPNKLVNPNEVFNMKRFKKHPYGHKNTGKSSDRQSSRTSTIPLPVIELLSESSHSDNRIEKKDDNIQSSDITSCSDIVDSEKQLPSFSSFSKRSDERINRLVAEDTKHDDSSSPARKIPSSSTSQALDSRKECESKGYFSLVREGTVDKIGQIQQNLENSDVSDVDVIGESDSKPSDIPAYLTSSTSLPLEIEEPSLDVRKRKSQTIPAYFTSSTSLHVHAEDPFVGVTNRTSPDPNPSYFTSSASSHVHSEQPFVDVTNRKSQDFPAYFTSSTSLSVNGEEPFIDIEQLGDNLHKVTSDNSRKTLVDIKTLSKNGHRAKSFSKSAEFFTENNKFHKVHDVDAGELSDDIVDIEGEEISSDDEVEVSKVETRISCPKSDDLSEQDSDVECSLVEGHKTFEVLDESDKEDADTDHEHNDPDIDVLRYSEDEVTLDVETVDYSPSKTDVENKKYLSEAEHDKNSENVDVESMEEPNSYKPSPCFDSPYQLDSFDLLRNAPLRNAPSALPQDSESDKSENIHSDRTSSHESSCVEQSAQLDSFHLKRNEPSDAISQTFEPSTSELNEQDKTDLPYSQSSSQYKSPYQLDSFDLLRNAPRGTPSQNDSEMNENDKAQSEMGNSYASPYFDSPYQLDSFDLLRNAPRIPSPQNDDAGNSQMDERENSDQGYFGMGVSRPLDNP